MDHAVSVESTAMCGQRNMDIWIFVVVAAALIEPSGSIYKQDKIGSKIST